MGSIDMERQAPNVGRMKLLGATVVPVTSGDQTLRAAVDEALRDWVSDPNGTYYCLGSAIGPHPYPYIVRELQSVIGKEIKAPVCDYLNKLAFHGYDTVLYTWKAEVTASAAPKPTTATRIATACFHFSGARNHGAATRTTIDVAAGNAIICAAGPARVCQNSRASAATDGSATANLRATSSRSIRARQISKVQPSRAVTGSASAVTAVRQLWP